LLELVHQMPRASILRDHIAARAIPDTRVMEPYALKLMSVRVKTTAAPVLLALTYLEVTCVDAHRVILVMESSRLFLVARGALISTNAQEATIVPH